MVKNLFKKEILYSRLSQAAKAFAAAPSPCPKPGQAIKCHRGGGGCGGVPAFRCQTILDHFFHQFAGETSFPQLILSQKIEDCRGMWNVEKNHIHMIFMYSGILTNWQYIFMIGQGFSNRQRLAFHGSPSFNWCLPPSMLNSLPGKTNLKALYCLLATQFHTKRFFLQMVDFTWLPRPPAGVHLVHWGAPEPCFLSEGWSLRCALEHHLVEIPH